ncbi:MAG TPA: 4-hydroxybenzoyl-CoA reductase subunit beta [Casimicrobiaceae bacterium]|nr:4-hydroxybenzoyl-CoA reductase subunit beta [Casimicrobiaceae bacterium]
MESMLPFVLRQPPTVAEAARLLSALPDARVLAGGTDLVPNLRRRIDRPAVLIDVHAIPELAAIRHDGARLVLGAGVTLASVAANERIAQRYLALAQAARSVAAPGHRAAATIGGNLCLDTRCVFYNHSEWWREANGYCLKRGGDVCHVAPQGERCHAAYSGDLAAALLALDAEVEIVSTRGRRAMPLDALYRDDGAAHLTLARDELLVQVRIPAPAARSLSGYRKSRVRGAIDFPLAGVACALAMRDGVVSQLRIAITGANSRPIVLADTDALLGRAVDDALLAALTKLVQKQVSPMRTTLVQANHRRQVAAVLARRLVAELAHAGLAPTQVT